MYKKLDIFIRFIFMSICDCGISRSYSVEILLKTPVLEVVRNSWLSSDNLIYVIIVVKLRVVLYVS